ncbi:MAG: TonB family protein, partial [Woeseiaceae bacterium]|nr:TonB family protein [Woeseiaceae bacterium]
IVLLPLTGTADEQAAVETAADDVVERVPLHTVVPVYPEKARRARVEGEVEVCFNIDRDGGTRRVAVRRSSNRVFEKPAREAVKASTFLPLEPGQKVPDIKSCRTFRFFLERVAVE